MTPNETQFPIRARTVIVVCTTWKDFHISTGTTLCSNWDPTRGGVGCQPWFTFGFRIVPDMVCLALNVVFGKTWKLPMFPSTAVCVMLRSRSIIPAPPGCAEPAIFSKCLFLNPKEIRFLYPLIRVFLVKWCYDLCNLQLLHSFWKDRYWSIVDMLLHKKKLIMPNDCSLLTPKREGVHQTLWFCFWV